jgi:hypothetical protein
VVAVIDWSPTPLDDHAAALPPLFTDVDDAATN